MSEVRRWAHTVQWEGLQISAAYMAIDHGGEYVMHADYAALHAETEALRAEIEEMDALLNRQADLLRQTAIALRGPEPDLTRYSHADIPERVKLIVAERDTLSAELAAIKGQEPVAFYWQDIGYPEPRKHGPYFGWPSEAALRNVDGAAIPVLLYTLPAAPEGGEV